MAWVVWVVVWVVVRLVGVGLDSSCEARSDPDVMTMTVYSEKENVVVIRKCMPGPYLSSRPSDCFDSVGGEVPVGSSWFGNVGLNIVVDYTMASDSVPVLSFECVWLCFGGIFGMRVGL